VHERLALVEKVFEIRDESWEMLDVPREYDLWTEMIADLNGTGDSRALTFQSPMIVEIDGAGEDSIALFV